MMDEVTLNKVKELCQLVDIQELLKEKDIISDICSFERIVERSEIKSCQKKVKEHKFFKYNDNNQKHLWAFYGYVGADKWACIEVGSSDDILGEICSIIKLMYEPSCDIEKKSVLHDGVVIYKSKSYTDKICYKYRYMNKLFEKFWWVEINVDKYQGDNDKKYNKTDYAEVTYAYKSKALIWNPAPAMMDRRNRKNQEKQILREKYNINI